MTPDRAHGWPVAELASRREAASPPHSSGTPSFEVKASSVGVLRSRLAEPWRPSSLAGAVQLSRSRFVREFDATVGSARSRTRD